MPTVERYDEWVFERDGQWWVFGAKCNRGPFATKDQARYNVVGGEKHMDEQLQVAVETPAVEAEVVVAEEPKKVRKPRAKKAPAEGAALVVQPEVEDKIAADEAKAREALARISEWAIVTQDDMNLAGQIEAQALKEKKDLEAELKDITSPMRAAEKKVRDKWRPSIAYREQIIDILKGKVREFRLAAAAAQDAALRAIAESGGKGDASTLAVAHGAEVLELPSNLREKVYHTWKCVDFSKVPDAYKRVVLDEAMITAVVDRDGMQTQIPGLTVERQVDIHNKPVRK